MSHFIYKTIIHLKQQQLKHKQIAYFFKNFTYVLVLSAMYISVHIQLIMLSYPGMNLMRKRKDKEINWKKSRIAQMFLLLGVQFI